jgi:hypothetical protein
VPIYIEIFDWDKDGGHDTMGGCEVTLRQLLAPGATFEVIEPAKKAKSKGYKNSGESLHGGGCRSLVWCCT